MINLLLTFIPFILLAVVFFVVVILPQIKYERKVKFMRDNIEIGDEVVTNGGIKGIVTYVNDDSVTIETGGNRTKLSVEKWAIAKLLTVKD